ncbi:hypothetical protein [Streptomyces massasporeus]|uniref:hypothetical protein n=1 Tax=Streptomyces massasporeus TaxID=67324 RepID=UPI0036683D1C
MTAPAADRAATIAKVIANIRAQHEKFFAALAADPDAAGPALLNFVNGYSMLVTTNDVIQFLPVGPWPPGADFGPDDPEDEVTEDAHPGFYL